MSEHLLIVGGGQAAAQAVQSLRQQSFAGAITLLTRRAVSAVSAAAAVEEISGRRAHARTAVAAPGCLLRGEGCNARAERASRAARRRGSTRAPARWPHVRYDRLLLATGSRVRGLDVPGATLPGVHYLRTIARCRRHHLVARRRRAGAAGRRGVHRPRGRGRRRGSAASTSPCSKPPSASWRAPSASRSPHSTSRASCRGRGDSLRRGRQGAAWHDPRDCGRDRRRPTVPVRRRDRRHRHRAQRRARGRARGCPAANGIVVDEFARTADPHILAAGDCTNHPHPLLERRVRLESVPNAIHQAKVAAATLLGAPDGVLRGAVVLVRPIRLEAADRGIVGGL